MGEVYRARDVRLQRNVAVKILPFHLSSPALRERFDREAKTISSLSHPNICSIFDVGHEDGIDYLVMEYLEGESLAGRLAKGALPIDQVLRYGAQIADALEAAHRHGVVHRDVKPGNVMLTKSGAKLLDFGLARIPEPIPRRSDVTTEVRVDDRPLTEQGSLVGTFAYMAPEQLEGKPAGTLTDIFALGVTLYEMTTGRRPFEASSRAGLIAAILEHDPRPVATVQPAAPAILDRVIAGCLAKNPDDRWQSAHDVAALLRWTPEAPGQPPSSRVSRPALRSWVWIAAALAIGAVAGWLIPHRRAALSSPVRFALFPPPATQLWCHDNSALAISPDGSRIAYTIQRGTTTSLIVRNLSQLTTTELPIEQARSMAFSPDGRSLAMITGFPPTEHLLRVSLDNGEVVDLGTLGGGVVGICWRENEIDYAVSFTGGIWAIPASGGVPRQLVATDAARGVRAIFWPQALPDGTLIGTVWTSESWDNAKIMAFPPNRPPVSLVERASGARYMPPGYLVYGRGGSLHAVPFDARSLRVTGPPVPLLQGVTSGIKNGDVQFAVSANGTLVYLPGGVFVDRRNLVWIDGGGHERPIVPTARPYANPSLSPDGTRVAFTQQTAKFDIWQLDIARDTVSRVSFGEDDSRPAWSRDGRRIFWSSSRGGRLNIYSAPADASEGESRVTTSPDDQDVTSTAPDGTLALNNITGSGRASIFVKPPGATAPRPLLQNPNFDQRELRFSPDARWIVYRSNESGRDEAYLRSYAGPPGKWQVSTDGATGVAWPPDSPADIVYQNGRRYYLVHVETQPEVRIEKPRLIFEGDCGGWDVGHDRNILCVKPRTGPIAPELDVVLHWGDDVARRVPRP